MKLLRPLWSASVLCGLLAALALTACSEAKPKVKTPARLLYYEGQALMDQQLYAEAITKFEEVSAQNPGTLLGSFAHLQIAEIRTRQEEWVKAETNYRLFLTANQGSHLTPFVLYRLVKVNYQSSFIGVFFPEREVDRDMQPNRQIIEEYKRFFFLYPDSIFLDEVRQYARAARETLADYERMVGDFYFRREHYRAAASRYLYLLRNHPGYPEAEQVLERLVEAYRRSQQTEQAEVMQRLLVERYGQQRPAPPEFDDDTG